MKKIKITTNKGKIFDFFLNLWLNYLLWYHYIFDDEDAAIKLIAKELYKLGIHKVK